MRIYKLLDDFSKQAANNAEMTPFRDPEREEAKPTTDFEEEDDVAMRFREAAGISAHWNIQRLEKDQVWDAQIYREWTHHKAKSKEYVESLDTRKRLPTYQMANDVLATVKNSAVTVVSGETGCGKTTQVPQLILDDAIAHERASLCHIVVTQPRRISAISVAHRVASERGESLGQSIGYNIRLENREPRARGSITFCTTGILLRRLTSDTTFQGVSHVIVDEVHERDMISDFLLILLKRLHRTRPDLKIILMSATINSDVFVRYFEGAPHIAIPGRQFPVSEIFLEDIVPKLQYHVDQPQYRERRSRTKKWRRTESESKDDQPLQSIHLATEDWEKLRQRNIDENTIRTCANLDYSKIDYQLLEKVIEHIDRDYEGGGILIFLPGWTDIKNIMSSLQLHALHSMIPQADQQKVFAVPPSGVRKIVFATNIAETSITIEDIVHVVDCGKIKQTVHDVKTKTSHLLPVWVAKANAKQRKGRAGRVKSGKVFRLFTSLHYEQFQDFQIPELLRSSLVELCLQIKVMELGKVGPFLAEAIDPPKEAQIKYAISFLQQIHGMNSGEQLTSLGRHLAHLPVNPQIGRLLIFGAIFGCLTPTLIIASALGHKDPFVVPMGKEVLADQARAKFAGDGYSDHIALVKAFSQWEESGCSANFARRNFLNQSTLLLMSKMCNQFEDLLQSLGFLHGMPRFHFDRNATNEKLLRGITCAGLYPHILTSFEKKRYRVFRDEDGQRCEMHPKSVLDSQTHIPSKYLAYYMKMKSTAIFVHDATVVFPMHIVFFGGELASGEDEHGDHTVIVDGKYKFLAAKSTARLLMKLRTTLDDILLKMIQNPFGRHGTSEATIIEECIEFIRNEELMQFQDIPPMEEVNDSMYVVSQ
eukprot:Clim_evm61s147 gene=Clim_evmTU61s147